MNEKDIYNRPAMRRELNQFIDFQNIQIFRCSFINIKRITADSKFGSARWCCWCLKRVKGLSSYTDADDHNFNSISSILSRPIFKHSHIILKLKCGLYKWNFSPVTLKHSKHPVPFAQQHHLSFGMYARAAPLVSTIPKPKEVSVLVWFSYLGGDSADDARGVTCENRCDAEQRHKKNIEHAKAESRRITVQFAFLWIALRNNVERVKFFFTRRGFHPPDRHPLSIALSFFSV